MIRWLGTFVFLVILLGVGLPFLEGVPWLTWLGTLPGDLAIHKGNITLYLPLTTSLLISILLSLLFKS